MASRGCGSSPAAPSTSMVPPDGRIDPGERREQLVLPLALERDDAGDLAVVEVERDIVQLGADAAGCAR